MEQTPKFARVRGGWFLLLDGGIVILCVASFSRSAQRRLRRTAPRLSPRSLRVLLGATVGTHFAEAVYAARAARVRGLPVGRWTIQTFVVGFPSLRALSRLAP